MKGYQCCKCGNEASRVMTLCEQCASKLEESTPFASTNSSNKKLRKIIIELGCRGVIGASERDTAIVNEICKREGIEL